MNLFKNTFFVGITEGFNFLGAFLFIVVGARYLGVEKFGELSFAIAISSTFSFISEFGLTKYTTMSIAKNENFSEIFYLGLASRILLSLLLIIVVLIYVLFRGIDILGYIIIILSLSEVFKSLSSHYQSFFRGRERMDLDFLANGHETIIQSIIGIYFILNNFNLLIISFSFFFARLIRLISNILIVYIKYKLKFKLTNIYPVIRFIKNSFPYGIGVLIDKVYSQIPAVIIMTFWGPKFVGIFQAAFKIINGLSIVISPIVGAYYPRLSNLVKNIPRESYLFFEKFLRHTLILTFIISIPLAIFGKEIILLLYNNSYEKAGDILVILSYGLLIRFVLVPYMYLFASIEKQWYVNKILFIGSLLFLIIIMIFKNIFNFKIVPVVWTFIMFFNFILIYEKSINLNYKTNFINSSKIIIITIIIVSLVKNFAFYKLVTNNLLLLFFIMVSYLLILFYTGYNKYYDYRYIEKYIRKIL